MTSLNNFIRDIVDMFNAQRKLYNRAHKTYDDKANSCKINGHQYIDDKIFMTPCVDGTYRITKTYKCKKCGKVNYVG